MFRGPRVEDGETSRSVHLCHARCCLLYLLYSIRRGVLLVLCTIVIKLRHWTMFMGLVLSHGMRMVW